MYSSSVVSSDFVLPQWLSYWFNIIFKTGNSSAVDEDLRRRGMKRYVPTGALAENCDSENHRSKIRIVTADERTTEDDESDVEDKRKVAEPRVKKADDKDRKLKDNPIDKSAERDRDTKMRGESNFFYLEEKKILW